MGRVLRHALRAALAALALTASTTALAADGDVRVYEGPWGASQYTYSVTCVGDDCVLTSPDPQNPLRLWLTEPITVRGGVARKELPDQCGVQPASGGAFIFNHQTLTLALTDESMTATIVEDAGRRQVIGTFCSSQGQTVTVRATRVAAGTSTDSSPDPSPSVPAVASGQSPTSEGGSARVASSSRVTSSQLASGEPNAPSVLSALRTVQDVDAKQSMVAVLVTMVLVLLVAFPTTLLNSAAENGSDQLSAWWRRRHPSPSEKTDEPRSRWWWAAGGVLAAGVIASFVDPQFGLNAGSVRTLFSVLVAFGLDVVLGWLVVVWLVRRAFPAATASYAFRPLTLLLVAAAVVFTRLTGFEPGVIFGLVAGVGFSALVGRAVEAKATLAPLGYGAVVALLAWGGYHLVHDATSTLGVFVAESLSAAATAGLAALPIALFPITGMAGATVFAWSRRVWAACYAFALFAFFVVLMPTPYAWDEVNWTLKGWLLVYLVYLAAALAAWWFIRRRGQQDIEPSLPHSEEPEGAVASASE